MQSTKDLVSAECCQGDVGAKVHCGHQFHILPTQPQIQNNHFVVATSAGLVWISVSCTRLLSFPCVDSLTFVTCPLTKSSQPFDHHPCSCLVLTVNISSNLQVLNDKVIVATLQEADID
jgi:hypothetical protein